MSSSWDCDYRYEPTPLFEGIFRCSSLDNYDNSARELETGNKIIMPQSSINQLHALGVPHPWFFKIEGYRSGGKVSHCGVLEFGAEEGCVCLPRWMMANLSIEEGDDVILHDATLSRGIYMKLQPHAKAFVELSNPKAVLEWAMRGFSCLTTGDTIAVRHNDEDFYLDVLEVWPRGEAISLLDTDCSLDFAPPFDYHETRDQEMDHINRVDRDGEREEVKSFKPFTGGARRLDGTVVMEERQKKREKDGAKEKQLFKPFTGRGRVTGGSFFDSN